MTTNVVSGAAFRKQHIPFNFNAKRVECDPRVLNTPIRMNHNVMRITGKFNFNKNDHIHLRHQTLKVS